MNLGALNLVMFIIAQGVGIGTLAPGSLFGLIPIVMSSASGYIGLIWLRDGLKK